MFDSGLIDEVICDVTQVIIKRIGISKYKIVLNREEKIEFDLWTTLKGKLSFIYEDEYFPNWMSVEKEESNLESLIAYDCTFHLEHCDRGAYLLNISRNSEMFCGSISTNGYIKTKLN